MSSYRDKPDLKGGCGERDSQWEVMPGGTPVHSWSLMDGHILPDSYQHEFRYFYW